MPLKSESKGRVLAAIVWNVVVSITLTEDEAEMIRVVNAVHLHVALQKFLHQIMCLWMVKMLVQLTDQTSTYISIINTSPIIHHHTRDGELFLVLLSD